MRTGLVEFEKLSFSWIRLVEALDFKVLHAYVMIRIKEVIEVQIFSSFNTSIFPLLLLRYIHLMSTDVYMHNIPLYKGLFRIFLWLFRIFLWLFRIFVVI